MISSGKKNTTSICQKRDSYYPKMNVQYIFMNTFWIKMSIMVLFWSDFIMKYVICGRCNKPFVMFCRKVKSFVKTIEIL